MSNPYLYHLEDGSVLHTQRHGDAGVDLPYTGEHPLVLKPGDMHLVQTGVRLNAAGHTDFVVDIRSRSGMTFNQGIVVANSPGTIDSGYTGEILVILHNVSRTTQTINIGDRIAQAVFLPIIPQPYGGDIRGEGGLGSTGEQ